MKRSPTGQRTPTHQRPLTPLSYLSSPAPDLASTLHTAAADAADEANTSFLRDSLEALDQAAQPTGRTYVDSQRDPRLSSSGTHTPAPQPGLRRQETADDLSRRERLQRVLTRLNRLGGPTASSNSAYSNRTPSPHRQSLYDWAPAYDEHNDESELDAILADLRRQQPETSPELLRLLGRSQLDGLRNGVAPETARGGEASESHETLSERRRRERERERLQSLRNRAVMQRARQESSPSATDRVLRYVMERERSGMSEEEERARGTGWFRPSPRSGTAESGSRERWLMPPQSGELRERDRQERVEAFRRGYLAEDAAPRLPRISTPSVPSSYTAPPSSTSSAFLENALKYLSDLRSCLNYEDALATAIDNDLGTKEFFADKHDDFVMDLDELDPPPGSSWMQSGAVFEGHQHASTSSMNLLHHRQTSPPEAHVVEQINPNYRISAAMPQPEPMTSAPLIAPFDATRPWLSHTVPPAPRLPSVTTTKASDPTHDHWPVRVQIHTIDWHKMTLQGTMEAYDVPQHPASINILNPGFSNSANTPSGDTRPKAGKKTAPITTYLEGHIIDLRTNSFLTPTPPSSKKSAHNDTYTDDIAFPAATPNLDAQNWLALPPFSTLPAGQHNATPADTLARLLLSKSHLATLNSEYIFMRWKEKCFIHPKDSTCTSPEHERRSDQDRGHGLTISGFYYVSLRRSDGEVEGLYFDPSSTPYQHLRLKGKANGWVSWEFT